MSADPAVVGLPCRIRLFIKRAILVIGQFKPIAVCGWLVHISFHKKTPIRRRKTLYSQTLLPTWEDFCVYKRIASYYRKNLLLVLHPSQGLASCKLFLLLTSAVIFSPNDVSEIPGESSRQATSGNYLLMDKKMYVC